MEWACGLAQLFVGGGLQHVAAPNVASPALFEGKI
jgi:hypothetical protein